VTDAGLAHLSGLAQLRRLYLHDLAVTDTGLVHLGKLANLEVLALEKHQGHRPRAEASGKGWPNWRC